MGNMMGDKGNGLYSVAFGIYGIALTISSYSLPLAVSKMVSARVAKAEYQNMRRVLVSALVYALIAGMIAMNVLYFGAGILEGLYRKPGLARPLRVLAPTTFIVALLGVFRGYFQGHGDMVPTSVSQIMEQIVNAAISVLRPGSLCICTASRKMRLLTRRLAVRWGLWLELRQRCCLLCICSG